MHGAMVLCTGLRDLPLNTVAALQHILMAAGMPTVEIAVRSEGMQEEPLTTVTTPRAESSGPPPRKAPAHQQMRDTPPPMSASVSVMVLARFGVVFCGPFLLWWALQIGIMVYVCRRTAPEDLRMDMAALPNEDLALLIGFLLMAIVNLFRRIYRYGADCSSANSVLKAYRSWNANHDCQQREGWPLRLRLVTCVLVLAMVIQGIAVMLFALCMIFLMLTSSSTSDPGNLVLLSKVIVLACVLEFDNGFAQSVFQILCDAQHGIRRRDDATTPSQYTEQKVQRWDDAVFQALLSELPNPQVEPSGRSSSLAPLPGQCPQVASLSSTDRDEEINGSSHV